MYPYFARFTGKSLSLRGDCNSSSEKNIPPKSNYLSLLRNEKDMSTGVRTSEEQRIDSNLQFDVRSPLMNQVLGSGLRCERKR